MTFDTIIQQTGTKDTERWELVFLTVAETMQDEREQAVRYVRATVEAMERAGLVPAFKACRCKCHDCCIPLDQSCDECGENHHEH